MNVETSFINPAKVTIQASIPPEEVAQEQNQVTRDFVRTSKIPGFRPGKAPVALVASRFAKEIRDETENRLLRRAWNQVLERGNYRLAGPLGVKEAHWDEDGSYRFIGEFEVYPSLTLSPLSAFQPPPFPLEPTEEEVEEFLKGLAERHATWQGLEEGEAQDGMLVEAEVRGEFPQGGGDPFQEDLAIFQLGAGEVYPEIESAVRGLKLGGEAIARRELPQEEGVPPVSVEYKLKVKGLRKKVVPQVDDEFARQMNVEGGVEGLREKARELLRQAKKRKRLEVFRQALVQHLMGPEPFPLPPRVVEEETRRAALKYAESLHRHGADVAKLDWEDLLPKVRASVEARLREEYVLDRLAEELQVQVLDEEVDVTVRGHAQEAGLPYAELRGNLAKDGGLAKIRDILRRERAVAQALAPWLEEG